MDSPIELTLEQEFELQKMLNSIEKMDRQQTQEFLMEAMRQLMLKDNWIRQLFKQTYL